MKKYLLLIILILFIPVSVYASWFFSKPSTGGGGGGGSPCPSYYASAVLSWDGDHTSGVTYGCDTSGNPIGFTNEDTFTISTDYGEGGGDKGGFIDTANTGLTLTQTSDQYIDDDGAQTIWMRMYFPDTVDLNTNLCSGWYDGNDNIFCFLVTNDTIRMYYTANGNADNVSSGNTITTAAWQDVAISWDYPGGDISVYVDGWTESADVLTDARANKIDEVNIGPYGSGSAAPGAGNEPYITKYAIVSGYQAAVPW